MGQFHAICVGINAAPGTFPLDFSEKDARRIHTRLEARGFESVLLVGGYATSTAWITKVDAIVASAREGDLVVLYLSGHGRGVPNDGDSTAFHVIADEVDDDEVFRMWDEELLDDVFAEQVARLRHCNVLVIIDSCRAGGFNDAVPPADSGPRTWVQLMAACGEDGTSWGHSDEGSFFTSALLKVLDRPDAPETFGAWFDAATAPGVLVHQPLQTPVYFSSADGPIPFMLGIPVPRLDLSDVQAHVVYGFSHLPRQWLCFFRIRDVPAFATAMQHRSFVLTSAEALQSQPEIALALALSYRGLSKLEAAGITELGASPVTGQPSNVFRSDCIGRAVAMGDPAAGPGRPEFWKVGGAYEEQRADGMLLIARTTDVDWDPAETERKLQSAFGVDVVFSEHGYWNTPSREHFGFLDGLSKPGVAARPASNTPHPGVVPSSATSVHPLDTLLLTTAPAAAPWATNGSFLVYRRLAQDDVAFRKEMARLAKARGGTAKVDVIRAAERVIGRRRIDGVSLATATADIEPGGDMEAFEYRDRRCPVAAHVRKCNPRLDAEALAGLRLERAPVLYRRGVLFSASGFSLPIDLSIDDDVTLDAASSLDRGLHFMCYQSSIQQQYEFVVREWINNPHFPEADSGVDALIGAELQNGGRMVNLAGAPEALATLVVPTGGGYFFAPTLSGLRALGEHYLSRNPPGA